MLYGALAPRYDITLEPNRKIRLPATNICIKQYNEETVAGGPNETTKTLRMIKSTREPLVTRKEKLKIKLILEQSEWDREMVRSCCEREKKTVKEEDVEIERLKCKLKNMKLEFENQQEQLKQNLLKKQEDLKRLNLLNATKSRHLDALIKTHSSEYRKDCATANMKMYEDKRQLKQNVMLWETQYLDNVMFSDNPEEKAKQCQQQIHDFIINNRALIEMKRKEREEELKRDEDSYRRQVEEYEREQREEERKREDEKLALMKHRQMHVDYLNYKKKEKADFEKREREMELVGLSEQLIALERERERKRKEKVDAMEEMRQFIHMKQKYDEEMRQREKTLLDLVEKESMKRAQVKNKEQEELNEERKKRDKELNEAIRKQVEEKKRERIETEAKKQAETEYWTRERDRIRCDEEKEKWEKLREKKMYMETLTKQLENNKRQGSHFM